MCNELGRLSQGFKSNDGTDTLEFILHKYKPKDRRTTYVRAVCNIRPQKNRAPLNNTHCRRESDRLSRRGQHTNIRLDHHETPYKQRHIRRQIKIHVHLHKYSYLNNHMYRGEYITIQLSMIPKEFVEKYNIAEKSHNRYIYARVKKVM